MVTLGDRLRKARKTVKLTQEDVSKKLGVDFTTVSKWETDKAVPNIETLRTLSELYRMSLTFLLDGELTDEDRYRDLDPELVEYLKTISPEKQEHVHRYLRGEEPEPVFETEMKKRFTQDVEQGMDILDLFEKYPLTLGGVTPTREELDEIVRYFKAMRIMKMM